MLQSLTDIVSTQGSTQLKPYQYMLFNNLVKRSQNYEDILGRKDRLNRMTPSMQQVIHADMERMKTNKLYDRRLNQDLNGPKGLNWQCRQELQRLRSDERVIERDLIRLHHDLAKPSILPPVSRSPSLLRNQIARLSSIAEEHSPIFTFDKPKPPLEHTTSIRPVRTSVKHLLSIRKRPTMLNRRLSNDQSHSSSKHSFQHLIAKTSDDRLHHQHQAHIIDQQRRLVEQKLKQFLH